MLAAALRTQPEVVLMDVGMPRLNGYEATRRIREQPWGRGMSIIALTGWGQDADRARTREAGCDGHLVKPVSLDDLTRRRVYDAWLKHVVLVFPGHAHLTPEQHIAFSRNFGELELATGDLAQGQARRLSMEVNDISNLERDGKVRSTGKGRARRWVAAPADGFATTLLLVAQRALS